MDRRIVDHPILGKREEKSTLHFRYDGSVYEALKGETIAAALLASGVRTLRVHEETGAPRGIYCNIGHCFECRVTVDEVPGVRACLTLVKDGMDIRSGQVLPTPLKRGGCHK